MKKQISCLVLSLATLLAAPAAFAYHFQPGDDTDTQLTVVLSRKDFDCFQQYTGEKTYSTRITLKLKDSVRSDIKEFTTDVELTCKEAIDKAILGGQKSRPVTLDLATSSQDFFETRFLEGKSSKAVCYQEHIVSGQVTFTDVDASKFGLIALTLLGNQITKPTPAVGACPDAL